MRTFILILGFSVAIMTAACGAQNPESLGEFEDPTAISDDKTAEAGSVEYAACGRTGPNLQNQIIANASSPNAVQQRSGSSTSCVAVGALQPTDDARYFCWTWGHDGHTWTYLQSIRTGVRGWVRDDNLRIVGGVHGSNRQCGF